ncbi:DUF4129 domain-containing protein [Chitinophaga japonensis]|uniref:Uncharacterized protein DUF4129 n=1 Tax=Chitinophaga japonensis TaxID=104662 RepID=A0A562T3R0_CHIJA|nr:DUF4129 domain-containing protein [Chitinophaga japonensis]TWI88179.1 uncharacterized protein DUF4129 [Chitinophaga japonensis]
MSITDRYRRYLLLLAFGVLPLLLPAQELDTVALSIDAGDDYAEETAVEVDNRAYQQQEIKEHYLWDRAVPVPVDSTEVWWNNGGLVGRSVPPAVLKELRADKRLQYDLEQKENKAPSWLGVALLAILGFLQSIRIVIYIVLVTGLVLLLVFFLRQQGYRFSRKPVETDAAGNMEEDPGVGGYEKQVQEAIAAGQFRLAVRYLYLQALRQLAERQLITLTRDKTNADYLRVLLQTPWHRPFASLTRDYEYIWYGEVDVNAAQFSRIHGQFRQFINDLVSQ